MYLDLNRACQFFFIQALKSKSFETSQLRLLIEVFFQNEHDIAMSGVFWIDEVCYRCKVFDVQLS